MNIIRVGVDIAKSVANAQARLSLPNGIRLEVPVNTLAEVLPLLHRAAQEGL